MSNHRPATPPLAGPDAAPKIAELRERARTAVHPVAVLEDLARVAQAAGRPEEVVEAYTELVSQRPGSSVAHHNLAYHAAKLARADLAVLHYRRALELGIDRPEEVHLNLANVLSEQLGDDEAARRELRRALQLRSGYAPAWHNLGHLAEQAGDREEARRCFGRCLALDPANIGALARLADAQDFRDGASEDLLQRLLATARTSQDPDLHFAVGRAFDQRGRHDLAWRAWSHANALDRRAWPPYEPGAVEARVDAILRACTPDWLARTSVAEATHAPVFICGMFRSGSTLLEQMLAAHPAFQPAGEREFLPRLVLRHFPRYPEGLAGLDPARVAEWSRDYAAESARLHGEAGRLTDKRPDNLLYLGLAKAMFPRAHMVVTRRDWRDVAVSVYSTRLGPLANYATDLGDLRHWIRQHDRLVAHWQSLFGAELTIVDYEALVADPKPVLERLLARLGERWDDRCLEFHRLRNPVRTASVWQVRDPLHRGSVGRWERYRPPFEAAFDHEGLGPRV